jgi:hypothetical protein
MPIDTAFSYTRASIQTARWMSRTPKTFYGKSIQTMTTAAMASATSYTGTISMHMGQSSKGTGPTLIRLRGTPGGLQSASLTTLRPVDQSKFSKSTASRLTRDYEQTVYVASWHKVARRRGDRIACHFAAMHLVRYWHKADIPDARFNVRFRG